MNISYSDFVNSLRRLYHQCKQIDEEFINKLYKNNTITNEEKDFILNDEEVEN